MNYSEVKELLQAGFTAEEIRSMMNPHANNPQNTQINPQAENTNDSTGGSENDSEKSAHREHDPAGDHQFQAVAPAENTNDDEKFNQLNATMEKLIKTIQSSNLNNNSFDHMKETDINSKVDEIMAGIIRPEREKGGN